MPIPVITEVPFNKASPSRNSIGIGSKPSSLKTSFVALRSPL